MWHATLEKGRASKKWRGNGPDWFGLVPWFAKLTVWSKPAQSTSTHSCLFFAVVNLCFGHGCWRYLKRSKPTSLVLVTWFFQTWTREDFACVLSGVFASVFVWYFCVEKERTLRYPWHEINHSGTSDFFQLFNADLVWSLTTLQSCQNPLQRSKGRPTCMEGSKGSAESFRALNIEKYVQK